MKSYDEIDQQEEPVGIIEFILTLTAAIAFSVFIAWIFVYFIPGLAVLVIR